MTTTATGAPAVPGLNRPKPPTAPAWWADVLGAAFWLLLLAVTSLWVAGGGLTDLGRWPQALTSAGRLSGLVAASLMLVQVLLMARIPIVEQAYGQPDIARWHRWIGFTSFNLMLAHILTIVLGYALTDEVDVVAQFLEMVTDYRGVLLALAGTLLIILITITSLRRARRRLRYESWHLLHLYSYLGAGLAVPHMLQVGQEFTGNKLAASIGWGLWGAALGAVLVWRVGLPIYRSLVHDLRVESVVREGPGVVSVTMHGRGLDRLRLGAGQFCNWRFLGSPGWTRANPFSLSAAPTEGRLRITVKDLGDGSRRLKGVAPGDRVLFEGPYGRLHAGVRARDKVLLMASGIGITPMRALLEELPQRPGEVTLIYRGRTEEDLVLRAELDALAADRGARVHYLVGGREPSRASWLPRGTGWATDADALRDLVPDIAGHDVYLCGGDGWMAAARKAARACGVPADNIHSERFNW